MLSPLRRQIRMKNFCLDRPNQFGGLRFIGMFAALLIAAVFARGESTTFVYQGRLSQSGAPYNGTAEFAPTLWDSVSGGTQLQTNNPVSMVVGVTNGLFTLPLDFGDVPFTAGADRWLDLQVRTTLGPFTTLTPRQKLTATPYAFHAATANTASSAAVATTANVALTANSVSAGNIVGTLSSSQLPAATVTNNQSGVNLTGNLNGTFSGNGANLTNLSFNSFATGPTGVSISAWGWDDYGQLHPPLGLSNVVAISSGTAHSMALKNDGTVVVWGTSDGGQVAVPAAATNVVAIAAGTEWSMALKRDGTVLAWGSNNDNGQTNVPVGLGGVAAIAAGYSEALALKSNGTVVVWGAPTNVPPGLNNVAAIAAGYYHGLALQSNGTIVTWTVDNSYGQTNVPPGLSNVVAIAAGENHSLALKSDGTVVAWGDNSLGQLNIPPGLTNVVSIAGLLAGGVALKANGTIVVWGDNQYGETNVPVGLDNVLALASGSMAYHTMILRKQVFSPVAFLDSDNLFNGSIQVNGTAEIGGTEHVAGNARIEGDVYIAGKLQTGGEVQFDNALLMGNSSNIWLRWDRTSGLGWYGSQKPFAGASPEGPVLFGQTFGALGTTVGDERIALWWDYQKRVGINTTTPSATLDVRGDIKFGTNGQWATPAAEENLKILRGTITGGGAYTAGTGITASRTSTGVFALTFTNPFTVTPSITATAVDAGTPIVATVSGVTTSGAVVHVYAATNGAAANVSFYVTAIGPR
jgi:hypothetical protein